MAVGKEIRNKIKIIQNTQKITRAMEMVAASKMRRAQDRMQAARPYAWKIRNVVDHVAQAHVEYRHPFLVERPVARVGYIVITTDRGLCGSLNVNLFRQTVGSMADWSRQGAAIDLCLVGNKGIAFFKRLGGNIVAQASRLGDAPLVEDLIGPVKVMLDAYYEGRIDRLFLVRNEYVNTMVQRPQVEQLLPIVARAPAVDSSPYWDYLYEPDSKELLNTLFDRYITSLIYHALVENIACEMAARMIAMKSASDNARTLIEELQLVYNKARQAAITQELAEIVGGAAAI